MSPNATAPTEQSSSAPRPTALTLELRGVQKWYGGVHALRGADLVVPLNVGTVHGLLGENGSGKSTLLGVLSGQIRPNAGGVLIDGRPIALSSPLAALRHGIAMVAQETYVLADLTVAENIMLGRRSSRGPVGIRWSDVRRRAGEVLARLNLDYDLDTLVGKMRPDQQQMVEIARVLASDSRLLILDEPTSSLTDDQASALFGTIRRLRTQGVATIFVSHRLDEVMGLVDHLTILRDGVTVCSNPIADFTPDRIITDMVGPRAQREQRANATLMERSDTRQGVALSVRGLSVPKVVHDVDLQVAPGEIVGLAGLVGAGRSEMLSAIFGADPLASGQVEVHGKPVALGSTRSAIDAGLGYVPPDRKLQGLVLSMSVRANLTMVAGGSRMRLRAPSAAAERAVVDRAVETMRLRAASPHMPVGMLSGGNQQKVALGKWLVEQPRCLLLDEPTRGVDAGAKEEIHRILRESTNSGLALLVSSSEYDELLTLCDRILVAFRGRIVASLDRDEADQATIARYAGGYS